MRVDALEGLTVVECATFVTGPYAGALLADLGARVIKIEPPPDGDPYRYFAPDPHFSPNFAHLNRNKESVVLDLKSDKGREICIRLVEKADVFIENFRPGTTDRLRLGYEELRALNRSLVYCSITAYGPSGPYAGKPGFDTLGQAVSGLMSVLTDMDRPQIMGIALSDYVTGLSAGYGILGALMAREKTGEGTRLDTSLLQATLSFIGETAAGYLRTGNVPGRLDRVKNAQAFAFLAADGLPFVVHCSVPEKFWLALLRAVNRMDLAEDRRFKTRDGRRRNYEALRAELAAVFATRARGEWLERLEKEDVPASPLYNMAEVLEDPQTKHLGMVEEVQHPRAGRLRFVGPGVTYSGLARTETKAPPFLGEHTTAVLTELGYDRKAIAALQGQGVVISQGPRAKSPLLTNDH